MMLDDAGNPLPPEIEEVVLACQAEITRIASEKAERAETPKQLILSI